MQTEAKRADRFLLINREVGFQFANGWLWSVAATKEQTQSFPLGEFLKSNQHAWNRQDRVVSVARLPAESKPKMIIQAL
jgi:hypothetical protein